MNGVDINTLTKEEFDAYVDKHVRYFGTFECEFCQGKSLLPQYKSLEEQCESCWFQKEFEKNGYKLP